MTSDTSEKPSLTKEALECVEELLSVLKLIDQSVIAIQDKRVTLEEKMIRSYLHQMASEICDVTSYIHRSLAKEISSRSFDIEQSSIEQLKSMAAEMMSLLTEFHKIAVYDWNFLEQYFEHGFLTKLSHEHSFVERLQAVKASLQAGSSC
ncbi:MAG: hypothetical protein K2Z81_27715 [Cyanobacteria bacterium]|nr:hypothetical protein [Cyanobacteriota bacterium]